MQRRMAPSQQIWKQIETFFSEGAENGSHPFATFVMQSARYVLQVGIEREVSEYLGRQPHQRRKGGARGYRSGYEGKRVLKPYESIPQHQTSLREN